MDYKAVILYVGSIAVANVNEILSTGGLILNIAYIGYQLYTHHKKNKEN